MLLHKPGSARIDLRAAMSYTAPDMDDPNGTSFQQACAMKLHSTPLNRIPDGLAAGRLITPDGATLRHATAHPARGPARGTVTILTGRADFIEEYYETIEELLKRRYAVAIFDWRGQGLSSRLTRNRLRGHIRDFAQYDTDLVTFMREVALPECPPPHYALAHSMGAHILLRASWSHIWFERALLVSPMIRIRRHLMPRWWWRLLAGVAVAIGLGRLFVPGQRKRLPVMEDFPGNVRFGSRERFARHVEMLKQHPELGVAGPTLGWLRAALASSERIWKLASSHELPRWPMMAVAAGADRLVSTEATRAYARQVDSMSCIVVEGARHDLLMERDARRQLLWAAFDSFIGAQPPSSEARPDRQGAGHADGGEAMDPMPPATPETDNARKV